LTSTFYNAIFPVRIDADFESVKEKAGMLTPILSGVGPMTITMLMVNTLKAAKLASALK
jgi:methylenetetrahydrofolate dehydrogenase (NADP+)/methenyltetrahydrofolate cyclohydrolase